MVEVNKVHASILILQIIIAMFSLAVTSYFLSEELKLAQSERRADISIIGDEKSTFSDTTFYINFSGQIRNEGTRATVIKSIELRLFYSIDKGFSQSFSRVYDEPIELGWESFIFIEEQSRNIFIESAISSESMPQLPDFRKPDYCSINVLHDDGRGVKESTLQLEF